MRAIEISQPGGPEVLVPANRPMPEPGAGEVLIKVAAAGINRPDVFQRKGNYAPPPGASDLPGLEVAGEIVGGDAAAGGFAVGDKVCALVAGGGDRESVGWGKSGYVRVDIGGRRFMKKKKKMTT